MGYWDLEPRYAVALDSLSTTRDVVEPPCLLQGSESRGDTTEIQINRNLYMI